jgi:hypothetical protein
LVWLWFESDPHHPIPKQAALKGSFNPRAGLALDGTLTAPVASVEYVEPLTSSTTITEGGVERTTYAPPRPRFPLLGNLFGR